MATDMTGTQDTVQALLAERAIRQVLTNYSRSVDRLDRELMTSVFHPDAELHYEGNYRGAPDGLVDLFMEAHLTYDRHSHQITNLTVVVDGDRAVSEAYVTARIRSFPDGSGRRVDLVVAGRYLDRWSRRDGVWAIEYRRQINDVFSEYEVVGGADAHRLAEAERSSSRRNESDPSYAHLSSLGTAIG